MDVEVGQRDDRAHAVRRDELLQERDVCVVVDARRRDAQVRGVLRGRERVGVGGDRERMARERGHDVVTLADAGQQHGGHQSSWSLATVSERSPRRRLSSETTALVGMLPRLISGPNRLMSHVCW